MLLAERQKASLQVAIEWNINRNDTKAKFVTVNVEQVVCDETRRQGQTACGYEFAVSFTTYLG